MRSSAVRSLVSPLVGSLVVVPVLALAAPARADEAIAAPTGAAAAVDVHGLDAAGLALAGSDEPDRPLSVEPTPYTLVPGRAQVELDTLAASWASARGSIGDLHVDLLGVNLRVGVTSRVEAQVQWVPFRTMTNPDDPAADELRGVGDATLRLKANLWGNDGGATAAAVTPYLALPTATEGFGAGRVESGVSLVAAAALPAGVGAYVVPRVAVMTGDGGTTAITALAVGASRPVAGPLGATVEWSGSVVHEDERAVAQQLAVTGTLLFADDVELDLGAAVSLPDPSAFSQLVKLTLRR